MTMLTLARPLAIGLAVGIASASPIAAYTTNEPPAQPPEGASAYQASLNFFTAGIWFHQQGMSAELLAYGQQTSTPEPLAEGLEVTEEDGGVRYTLSADILFDFDAATLRPEARQALGALSADVRQRYPSATFVVEGHTDSKGDDAYNEELSVRRAESVRTFFSEQGFAADAIQTTGFGEARPAAPNTTPDGADDPEGRQRNRRVEILVRPSQ